MTMREDRIGDPDENMQGSGQEDEEGEGDVVMPGVTDDSSEEEEDDEEEARRIREGFIVDEDEEEEDEDEGESRRRRRKRRKRHHRGEFFLQNVWERRLPLPLSEEETLEEDDLDLLEENTGGAFKRKSRLTRLRYRDSESPSAVSSSKRRTVVESSEDDLDDEDGSREPPDIGKIWDDVRGPDDDEDMSDFIQYSSEEEGGVAMNEEAREARRQEKRQELMRRKRARVRPELVGIDAKYVFASSLGFPVSDSF